jgi:predicted Zn-dependent peptidase
MKITNRIFVVMFLAVMLSSCKRDKQVTSSSSGSNYFPVKEYTLKNGLKVFISVNKTAPRIQTAITVKAGSKYDPAETTGLAHYLEHMLFKGTKQVGTLNYEMEKPFLDSIAELFELRKNTIDQKMKDAIYKRIDSFSYEASKLAIPNEYDKMLSALGAKGTNAFTDRDLTCYINDIPSNGLEKWLFLESDRFKNLVLRIFHTELEAVYEEFNLNTAYDNQWSMQAVDSLLLPNHPYGTQTTIGLSDHLKNPSLANIHNYFNTYYVPNNCAIVLSGDLDPDKTIKLIEKYFGEWQAKEVPEFKKLPAPEIKEPLFATKTGQEPEHVILGYRFDGADTKDPLMVKLIDAILSNGKGSGILDLNLKLGQKALEAFSLFSDDKDYTIHKLYGEPMQGQTLEQVKDLLLTQIDSVKQGRFPDWMLQAVIDNEKLSMMRKMETNQGRVFDVVYAFAKDIPLEKRKREIDELSKITKADIIAFANEHYKNNYAVCYKTFGAPSLFKVEKPAITPVFLNKDTSSKFRIAFDEMKEGNLTPNFCDYAKEIKQGKTAKNIPVDYQYNKLNKTFSLSVIFDMGSDHDQLLSYAIEFLPYMGTDRFSSSEIKQEFYKLGLEFDVYASRDEARIVLSGLEENSAQGLELLEYLLKNCKADKEVYAAFAENMIKKRADAKLDKDVILWEGLFNYGKYGAKNPFNNVLSNKVIAEMNPDLLSDKIHELTSFKHIIYYYGQQPIAKAIALIDKYHQTPSELRDYPEKAMYPELSTDKPKVYWANYNMKQAQIIFLAKAETYDKSLVPAITMFNEYYGGSMASVVFQEIREQMALAYSAFGSYSGPGKKEESNYIFGFIGTQADKLPLASAKLTELLTELPKAEQQFDMSRTSIQKRLESEWITRESVYYSYRRAQKLGLDYDIRSDVYEQAKTMTFNDVKQFFDTHIKGKNYVYLVVGNKSDLDLNALAKLGEVSEIKLDELYGY